MSRLTRAEWEEASFIDWRRAGFYRAAWTAIAADTIERVMPIIESLMAELIERYGESRGRHVYHALEAEGKGPFSEGGKYRKLHEDWAKAHDVPPIEGKKKPPR